MELQVLNRAIGLLLLFRSVLEVIGLVYSDALAFCRVCKGREGQRRTFGALGFRMLMTLELRKV